MPRNTRGRAIYTLKHASPDDKSFYLDHGGVEHWFIYTGVNGNGQVEAILHREDGPAWKSENAEAWYKHGTRHRLDGPAVIVANRQEWWVNGCSVMSYEELKAYTGCTDEDIICYRLKWGEIK